MPELNLNAAAIVLAALTAGAVLALASCTSLEKKAYRHIDHVSSLPPADSTSWGTSLDSGGGWVTLIPGAPGSPITGADIAALPEPARRYFLHADVVGKTRISSFSAVIVGRIRSSKDAAWMPLVMRQYNRLDNPARVVYIESPGKPMAGIDSFIDGKGRMLIRIAGLFTIADEAGPEMDLSAFVTFVNDLMLCPLAYFSLPVRWRAVDRDRFELSLEYRGMTMSALLTVDADGRLCDWKTDDRYASVDGENLKDRWSTPLTGEQEAAGLRVPATGRGIHDYDGEPFVYIELESFDRLVPGAKTLPGRL